MAGNTTNGSGGWSRGAILRELGTTYRLLRDPRVPAALKILLPVGALFYWISPVDLLPFMPFDDAAVMVIALYIFNQIAPTFVQSASADEQQNDERYEDGPTVDTTWNVVED